MNANEEANLIASTTFLPKTKNILRLLDDNGFKGLYTWELVFDVLTITFTSGPEVVCDVLTITFTGRPPIECDLSSDATHATIYEYLVRKYQDPDFVSE